MSIEYEYVVIIEYLIKEYKSLFISIRGNIIYFYYFIIWIDFFVDGDKLLFFL